MFAEMDGAVVLGGHRGGLLDLPAEQMMHVVQAWVMGQIAEKGMIEARDAVRDSLWKMARQTEREMANRRRRPTNRKITRFGTPNPAYKEGSDG